MRAALLLLPLGVALGCADDPRAPLEVFAASSLTEAFGELEAPFEAANPEVDLRLTFAGSQVLRLQIEQGARADLFASANEAHLRALDVEPRVFAENELALIVPPSNPAGLERFAELDRAERLVLGTDAVPVGVYARAVLKRAEATLGAPFVEAVRARVVSEESNARLVRAKVELGEADAALVYRTDVSARVREVPIPAPLNVRARYVAGVAPRARQAALAERFLDFLETEEARALLRRRGFLVGDG